MLRRTAEAGRQAGLEVSVCGELAASPLGAYLLLGLGITTFSMASSALPEIKKVIRSVPATDARERVAEAMNAPDAATARSILSDGLGQWLDLSLFSGRWNLSHSE
jgi:phosphotransferase system enzyme I (PtsI)